MGRKRTRRRQHFYFCAALLVSVTGCGLWQGRYPERELGETMQRGERLLVSGDYEGSLRAFQSVTLAARDKPPADAAAYKTGIVHAHPENPRRDLEKARAAFAQVLTAYPSSLWVEESQAWIGVITEAEKSKREIEQTRLELDRRQLELEKNRQAVEKSKQEIDRARVELEKTRQEIEKTKQVIEKSKQVDIEIDQKRRTRSR
jgi:hypothetical protein